MEIPEGMKAEVVKANFKKMIKQGWFCITDFRECCLLLGVHIPGPVLSFLNPLHCVHWGDMSIALNKQVLELIINTFNQEPAVYIGVNGEIGGTVVQFELSERKKELKLTLVTPLQDVNKIEAPA